MYLLKCTYRLLGLSVDYVGQWPDDDENQSKGKSRQKNKEVHNFTQENYLAKILWTVFSIQSST